MVTVHLARLGRSGCEWLLVRDRVLRPMKYVQKSDEYFRRIFEDGPLGIAIVSLDYGFIEVNKTLCQMVGYTESELLALTFLDLIHPEDVDKNEQLAQQLFGGERHLVGLKNV